MLVIVGYVNARLDCSLDVKDPIVARIVASPIACFRSLTFTFELPQQDSIRFLVLHLHFKDHHACWMYEPRANNPTPSTIELSAL